MEGGGSGDGSADAPAAAAAAVHAPAVPAGSGADVSLLQPGAGTQAAGLEATLQAALATDAPAAAPAEVSPAKGGGGGGGGGGKDKPKLPRPGGLPALLPAAACCCHGQPGCRRSPRTLRTPVQRARTPARGASPRTQSSATTTTTTSSSRASTAGCARARAAGRGGGVHTRHCWEPLQATRPPPTRCLRRPIPPTPPPPPQACQRYWTRGGALRDVPPGSGRRKKKSAAGAGAPAQAPAGPQSVATSTATAATENQAESSGMHGSAAAFALQAGNPLGMFGAANVRRGCGRGLAGMPVCTAPDAGLDLLA